MSFQLSRSSLRTFARQISLAFAFGAAILSLSGVALAQRDNKSQTQSGLSNVQRMDIMRSKLEAMRRSLDSAVVRHAPPKTPAIRPRMLMIRASDFAASAKKLVRC